MGVDYTNSTCHEKFISKHPLDPSNYTILSIMRQLCQKYTEHYPNTTEHENEFHRHCCHQFNVTTSTPGTQIPRDYLPPIPVYLLLVLLSPIGLTANSLIMVTVYKVKRLRNTTGYFICNLAFADILLILEVLLYFIVSFNMNVEKWPRRVKGYIFPSLDVFLASASLLLVTAVSIERGIAVARPLKYPRYLSEKRAKVLILCIWMYCFLLFVLGVLRIWITNTYYEKIFFYIAVTFSFFIPCIFVVTSYNIIVFSALKTMKMEKKICRALVAISLMNNDTSEIDQTSAPVRSNRCREIKVALKVTTLTCPFVCGWGYFMICNVYEHAAVYQFRGVANLMIIFLPFVVSSLNPLTYIMFTRTLRQSAWLMLSRSHAGSKLYRLVCQKQETLSNQPIRQRLVPSDRLKQMQFTSEHSKWLEMRNTQNTCI